jgi:hypothetical protein
MPVADAGDGGIGRADREMLWCWQRWLPGHDRLAFAFGQEKSLLASGVFHWVTVTVPPAVREAKRQFFFA